MADGLLAREKVEPGRGDAGRESMLGNRFTLGFGDEGRPTRPEVDFSDTADTGSASLLEPLPDSAETSRPCDEDLDERVSRVSTPNDFFLSRVGGRPRAASIRSSMPPALTGDISGVGRLLAPAAARRKGKSDWEGGGTAP